MPDIEVRCNNRNTKDPLRSCSDKRLGIITIPNDWDPKTQLYFLASGVEALNSHHDDTVDPYIHLNGHRL